MSRRCGSGSRHIGQGRDVQDGTSVMFSSGTHRLGTHHQDIAQLETRDLYGRCPPAVAASPAPTSAYL
jgi:hypothetical protein